VNLTACRGLSRTAETRVWYRLIDPSYLPNALGSAHTKKTPARFNPGPLLSIPDQFATLSLADDIIAAQFEAGAVLGSYKPGHYVSHSRLSFITMNVRVILGEVIDLTDPAIQAALGTNVQELTGDWDGYQIRNRRTAVSHPTGIAPTQDLGRALCATGVEGFRAISAKLPFHQTLTVFTENLRSTSSLTFTDYSSGALIHKIPPIIP
jgi:RES domain-containing protein